MGTFILTSRNERKWLCRCDCGTERYVLERSLRCGGSLSCGCLRRERAAKANSPDLTGRQFGELTVISKVENTGRGSSQWLCKCSCGEDYVVQGSLLTTGKRTRCPGKAHQKNYAYTDIAARRFGRLLALHPAPEYDRGGSVIWHCRCDCGREVDVSYNNLVYANQRSCGCRKKEHDRELHGSLTHFAGTSLDLIRSKKVPADNTTGYKGVYRFRGKYAAKIVFQKKQYYLGTYEKLEDAVQARRKAEEQLFEAAAEHYRKWQEYAAEHPEWAEKNPVEVYVHCSDNKLEVTLRPELGPAGDSAGTDALTQG